MFEVLVKSAKVLTVRLMSFFSPVNLRRVFTYHKVLMIGTQVDDGLIIVIFY